MFDVDVVKGPSIGWRTIIVKLLKLDLEITCVVDSGISNGSVQVKRFAREIRVQLSDPIPGHPVSTKGHAITVVMPAEGTGHHVRFVHKAVMIEAQLDVTLPG